MHIKARTRNRAECLGQKGLSSYKPQGYRISRLLGETKQSAHCPSRHKKYGQGLPHHFQPNKNSQWVPKNAGRENITQQQRHHHVGYDIWVMRLLGQTVPSSAASEFFPPKGTTLPTLTSVYLGRRKQKIQQKYAVPTAAQDRVNTDTDTGPTSTLDILSCDSVAWPTANYSRTLAPAFWTGRVLKEAHTAQFIRSM